ncbi:methyltransferase domain-containing protein [Nonomuraea sp. NPDC050404]|uniref:class I SAM-dependent methyltransferase n=1 Tax=Nonomuraea sp. NPDC050404 TaxID=3155783 RepID=UPI0033F9AE3C
MTDTKLVLELFDDLATDYDRHLPFFATYGRELVNWCGLRPGQRVLDLAAGRGAIAGPAASAVGTRGTVLAIDNAPGMLRTLEADLGHLPQLSTQVMDAHHLDLPNASFDVVTCGFTMHFLDDPAQALAGAHRVLVPGGLLAFSGPGPAPRDERWEFMGQAVKEMSERPGRKPDPFTPPARPLPELCAEAGFAEIEERVVQKTFELRDPQHYWDWNMSHGFRGFVESLGPELAEEFRAKVFEGLARLHADGGIVMRSAAAFYRMRRP